MRKSHIALVFDHKQPIYDCVVVDMNTQKDFLDDDGVLPIKNRELVLSQIKKLMEWTQKNHLPMISPINVHRPRGSAGMRSPLFNCIEGTPGQQKIPITLMPKRFMLEQDNSPALPGNLLENYMQVLVQKQTNDVFTNPKADRLFTRLQAKRFLVFGVGSERAIKNLGLGLLSRGKHPIIVSDACGTWDEETAELAIRQLEAKGAILLTTDEVIGLEPDELPVPNIEIHADVE
jgi:nicotinamidase-related amidase